ncbi:hypothetical protein AMTRI_Chr13g115840 [Amborella trichopoda]|uniref:SNF7 family protein n=1 Tax=Amborella trichopoda TaxID=13333 RepID=W1NSW9_AMBTC|nr:vacuolar protein sorting-associated protein 32 homolog 1 [Amborella trichopoda]ERN00222.1 hypothetical protein AMTR_s00111p00112330 [Amborella trichopoda]|eukprot:XP_006837368.3 vacuolar protein sorting-associated protein 32 homolog 1 [Amborella trichopoda]
MFSKLSGCGAAFIRIVMLVKLFMKPKRLPSTLDKLTQTIRVLEEKECALQNKIAAEVERAKEFIRTKNKRATIQCLKRKRLFEEQVEQLRDFQYRIHIQILMLEGAKAASETLDALKIGALSMQSIQRGMNIDGVKETMDRISEQIEDMRDIQEAVSVPVGLAKGFDDDDLDKELEQLERTAMEEELVQLTMGTSVLHEKKIFLEKVSNHDEELYASQEEMPLQLAM